jgi:hypothetical protein
MDIETSDIQKEIDLFLESFDQTNEQEMAGAGKIINYIIRQLNNESLKGTLDYYQYRSLVLAGIKGLFKLIYLDFLDLTPDPDRMRRLIHSDVVFASASNFLFMLFTRVYLGKDRDIILKQIEAQKPIFLSNLQK